MAAKKKGAKPKKKDAAKKDELRDEQIDRVAGGCDAGSKDAAKML